MSLYQPDELIAGRYRIVEALSSGGMGAVYLAEQVALGREVAIKVIRADLGESATLRRRFEHEARAVCQLRHPNIITYHDFGHDERGRLYLVMEYLPGFPGTELVYGARVPSIPDCVHVIGQLCSALAEAHQRGIIHRDLKWSNAMIVPQSHDPLFVKLIDFGILKVAPDGSSGDQREHLTQTGMLLGTPQYMSPEAICGRPIDGRSDQYSLAVMAYELFTGRRPFDTAERLELLRQHVQDAPAAMDDIGPERVRDAEIEAVILRGLAKSPDQRFDTVIDFHAALARACGLPEPSRPTLPARRPTLPRGAADVTPLARPGTTANGRAGVAAPNTGRIRGGGPGLSPTPTPKPVDTAIPRSETGQARPRRAVGLHWWLVGVVALAVVGFVGTLAVLTASREEGAVPAVATVSGESPEAARSGGDAPERGGEGPASEGAAVAGAPVGAAAREAAAASAAAEAEPAKVEPAATAAEPAAPTTAAAAASAAPEAAPPSEAAPARPAEPAPTSPTAAKAAAVTPGAAQRVAHTVGEGRVTIVAIPFAQVSVNGHAEGTTPLKGLTLKAGRATITLTHPTYGTKTRGLTVKANEAQTLTVDMRK